MSVSDIIKNSKLSKFIQYREGNFLYATDSGFHFNIPLEDVGKASLLCEDKTIIFMRWIRKQVEENGN